MPVTLINLAALNGIAGFDLGTLFNNGTLNIADSQFNGSVVVSGVAITQAIITAGVDPVQNGISLFEALAQSQYDNLSTQTLVQLLVTYARQAGTSSGVPADVGVAIAALVPGTVTAANAVSYIVQAADEVAGQSSQFGVSSTINATISGTLLGQLLTPLQGVLGSDPIAAGVQDLIQVAGFGATELRMLEGLGVSNAASVAAGFEGLLGTDAQSLTNSDLTLASPSAGADIANAVFAQYGTNSTGSAVGAALIQALAQQNGVDPVPALVYFTYQLAAQVGSVGAVAGTALSEFIANALVTSATAQTDIISAVIAIAAATGTTAQAIAIGQTFGGLFGVIPSGGGEGSQPPVASAVNPASNPQPALIAAINGTTIGYTQGLGLLVGIGIGIASNNARFTTWSEIGSELNILVTGGHLTQTQVVNALVANQIVGLTASYMTSSGLTYAQLGTALATQVQGAQITPTQALSFLGGFYSFSGATTSLQNATISFAASLINGRQITATAAFATIHTTDPTTLFGILAAASATTADLIANYQYLLDNGYTSAFVSGATPIYNTPSAGIATASIATNAAATSGNTLTFASLPSGVRLGYLVIDTTAPGAIANNTYVTAISGNTITLSGNVASAVGNGDTIAFYNQGLGFAIELLAVTPSVSGITPRPDNQIFTDINNGTIPTNVALDLIVDAVGAGGGSIEQQITEIALIAANTTLQFVGGQLTFVPNTGLMAAAAQEILTLADNASLTTAQLASAFAQAYGGTFGDLVQQGEVITLLGEIGGLTHQGGGSAQPLVAAVFGNLIAPSGTPTASQPLSPSFAAFDIAGGAIVTSNAALSTLIAVAGTAQNPGFDFIAGQYIAEGIDHLQFSNYFPTVLSDAHTAGTIDTVDAALLLGSVAAQTFLGEQSSSQTSDFVTQLAGYATSDSSVIPAFGTAANNGYDVYTAIQALALIGGGAPSLQSQAQSQIIAILQSGVNSVTADSAISFLLDMSQLVASSVSVTNVSASLNATVQSGIAGDIAAMISGGFVTVTSAVTDIGNFVGGFLATLPNVAANMIGLLEYLATYDSNYGGGTVANLEQVALGAAAGTLSVQAEISLILGANEIGVSTVITTLNALDQTVAAGAPLDLVINNELGQIGTTGTALLLSAAQGSPIASQLQTQALKISQLGDNLVVSGATNATASTGTTLHFASLPSGAVAGLAVVDLTNPGAIALGTTVASTSGAIVTLSAGVASAVNSGDNIAFYKTPLDSAATNNTTSTGTKVLNFASVPGDVIQGLTVVDLSNPAAFAAGTYVASTSGNTVTLSANVAATVGSGDAIAFYQPGSVDVLDAMIGNVGGSVTAANAIGLLLDLAAIGSTSTSNPALADATAALVTLANSNVSGTDVPTIVSDITVALINHNLTSGAGLSILAALAKASGTAEGYAQSAYATGLIIGYFTIAQLDAAVTAGTILPIDAIAGLSQTAGETVTAQNPAVTIPDITAEIVKIVQAYAPDANTVLGLLTAAFPTPSFITVITDGPNPSVMAAGYGAINTIVTAVPALGQGFFSAILSLTNTLPFSTHPEIIAPAEAELFGANGLVATGGVDPSTALSAIVGFPISQQLPGLVLLAGVPSAQSTVITFLEQRTGTTAVGSGPTSAAGSGNVIDLASVTGGVFQGFYAVDVTNTGAITFGTFVSAVSGNTVTLSASASAVGGGDTIAFYNPNSYNPYITTDTVIAAIAAAYGGASAFTALYETLLAQHGESATGAAAFVNALQQSGITPSAQLGVLVNLVADYQPAAISGSVPFQGIVNTLVTRIDTLLITGSTTPAALASALATLLHQGIFTGAQVIQTVAGFYDVTAPQHFIDVVDALPAAGISAATVTTGIVGAVTNGALSAQFGVDLMLVVGTETTPALQNAAAAAFGDALANGSAIAVNASTSIGAAISAGVVTASQVVTFMTQVLLTTPSTLSFASTEIASMVSSFGLNGLLVITAMAEALGPNALVASAATSAATASGNTLNFASVPAGVSVAQTVLDLTNPGAIPPFTAVLGATGATVTVSQSVAAAIANGDTIAFYNNLNEDPTIWGQIAVLGAAIASLTSGFGFTALQEAQAILAAVGYDTADLPPDYGIALLASFAGSGNTATMQAVGEAVAVLVDGGTAPANEVAGAFDASYLIGGVTTPAQLNSVIVGLLAGGSLAAAAALGFDIGFAQEPVSAIAATLSTAVSANTITALKVVDLAANLGLQAPAAQTVIAPLLASGAITGQAAIQELGTFIGATQLGNGLTTFTAAEFMSVFDNLAGASDSATQNSMGIGLAAVLASGKLGFSDAAAGLQGAVSNSIMTLGQAVAILVNAAAGSFALGAGETIAALVAGNPTGTQTAISDVETAVTNGVLTPAQGLALLAGMVDGGVPAAASAAADLLQARTISAGDLDTLAGAAIAGTSPIKATILLIAATYPAAVTIDAGSGGATDFTGAVIGQLQTLIAQGDFSVSLAGFSFGEGAIEVTGATIPDGLVGDTVTGPGIGAVTTVTGVNPGLSLVFFDPPTQTGSGTFVFRPASDFTAEQQIVAALPPATDLTNLIDLLVNLGTAAGATALGQTLFSIIESGAATPDDVVAAIRATGALGTSGVYDLTPIFALGSLAQTAALAPSGTYAIDPAVIQSDVYNAIVAMYPPSANGPLQTATQFVAQGFAALVQGGDIFKQTFLPVMVQLAIRDPSDYLTGSGSAFNTLLGAGTITVSDLIGAMTAAGVTGGAALVVLAGAIDINGSTVSINQNGTSEDLLRSAFGNFVNVATSAAALQSYATALQTATGLPAANAVGGLALLCAAVTASDTGASGIGGFLGASALTPVGTIAAASIASLVSGGQITEAGAYTVIGQTYRATGFNYTTLPSLLGLVGYALNDTAAAFVAAVAAGSYGTLDATVDILARLTGIDGQFTGGLLEPPVDTSNNNTPVFANIGLAVGAKLMAMVDANPPQLTLSQALADIAAIPFTPANLLVRSADAGVSDNNKLIVLYGMVGVANVAQQFAIGAAFGNFLNSGALPDLGDTRGLITYDQWALLLTGAVTTANASVAADIVQLVSLLMTPLPTDPSEVQQFTSLGLAFPSGALTVGQLIGDLDAAVRNGQPALTIAAAAAVTMLEVAGAAAREVGGSAAAAVGALFNALAAEVVSLVNGGSIDTPAAIAALLARAGNGTAGMQSAAGGFLGALEAAGVADTTIQTGIDTAIGAGLLTVAQAATIDGAAALAGSASLARLLGADIGTMIAGSQIGIADAIGAIVAGATTYADDDTVTGGGGFTDFLNAVVLLLSVAGAPNVAGLPLAAGEEIGALLNQNLVQLDETIGAIDGAAGSLTAAQSIQVLIGLVQSAGSTVPVGAIRTEVAVGAEFDALIGAGTLASSAVIGGLDQAIQAGTLSTAIGFGVLVAMASQSGSLTTAVTAEIASLINGRTVTADQALAALFATAGAQDFIGVSPSTDATIAQIVTGLESQTSITPAQVGQDITTAATAGSIAEDHAVNILLALSADAPTPGVAQAALDAIAGLLSNGIGVSALTPGIVNELNAGTLTLGTAISTLIGIAMSVDAAFPAVDLVVGRTMAGFIGLSTVPAGQFVSDLQAAVTGGSLTTAVEAQLLAQVARWLGFTINGIPSNGALPAALVQLAENGSPTAAAIFADIEALAAAQGDNYLTPSDIMTGFGVLIGQLAIGANATLQAAVAAEFASLVSRGLITSAQAGNYIAIVAANGLSADTAVLLYATGISAPLVAGAGIAALVNAGDITATQALSDIAATVPATLSLDGEIQIIAGMATGLSVEGSLNPLSSALIQLIENHTATATQVFNDIAAVAQLAGSYSAGLGTLLAGMGATSDTTLQLAVSSQIGALINSGALTATGVTDAIGAARAAGQLTAGQASALLLPLLANAGPALEAAIGAEAGAEGTAAFIAAQGAGTITAPQLVGILTGVATASQDAFVSGLAAANGTGFVSATAGLINFLINDFSYFGNVSPATGATALLQDFVSLNNSEGSTNPGAAVTRLWDDVVVASNSLRLSGTIAIWIQELGFDLVSDFGAFGSNSAQVQFETSIVNQGLTATDALNILNAFGASAPEVPSSTIASLVTTGAITVSAAMTAIEAAASGGDPTHLLYFLADLSASPALRAAAAQEIANLVQTSALTGSAAAAGIAAIASATASTNGVLGTISTPAAVGLLLAVYGDTQDSGLRAAVTQQLVGFFATPPSDITQAAIVNAIGTAVTNGQMSAATALQTLIQMDGAGGPGATGAVSAALEGQVAGYVGSNYSAFTSQLLADAANVTAAAGLTSLGWLLGDVTVPVSGSTTAITAIAGAEQAGTITGAQEASMLLGLFPDLLTIYNRETASFAESISLATTATSRLALINQWIADATAANSAASSIVVDLANLVTAGTVTPQALIADVSAAGTAGINFSGALTPAQQLQVLVGSGVYAANPGAVVTALVGATNTFDTRGYTEVVHDVIEMSGGSTTFDQALLDVQEYAYTHNANVDSTINELISLTDQETPGGGDLPSTVPYTTAGNAGTTIIQTNIATAADVNIGDAVEAINGRNDDGAFAAQLAVEVVEGAAGLLPGAPSLTQAANSLSGFQQAAFYNDVIGAAYNVRLASGATQDALTNLINSVPLQSNHSPTSASNLSWDQFVNGDTVTASSATTLTTGFFQDEAYAAEIQALSGVSGSAAANNTQLIVGDLAEDLTDGYAETNIINMLASGQFEFGGQDQDAIAALNDLLAPVMANESANAAQLTQTTAFAWLAMKSVEYIEGNYQIVTNSSGQHTIVIPQSEVPALYGDVIAEFDNNGLNPYQGYVLTGLGALAAIQGDGVLSQGDTDMVAHLTQTIFDNDAQIAGSGNLASDTNASLAALQGPITKYLQGFGLVGTPQSGASGSTSTFAGIYSGLIQSPADVQAYIDIGARIAAQGVPGLAFLNTIVNLALEDDAALPIPSLQDFLLKSALGDAGGSLSTALGVVGGIGSVGSLIFSINAVDNALGINDQQKDALEGSFGLLNETGNLIGNILVGELASIGSAGVDAAVDLGDAFAAMGRGDAGSLLANAEGVATFWFEMANFGFTPQDIGADAETFGATMVDLFSGNTGNLAADGKALGAALLHTLTNNLFVASASATVEQAIANINTDWNEFLIGIGYNSPPPPPPPPPPPTITLPDGTTVPLISDNLGDGGKAYADPNSTSNWGSFYHGTVTDGYIANANVFVDPTGTGIFHTGDYTTTTDSAGNYSLPAGISGSVVITGGTDIATGLPFIGTFTAPTGATSVTALTTLINTIAQSNGGDLAAATQQVDTALGLPTTLDPSQTNPILAAQNGSSNAAQLLSATVQVQNTLSLLTAAGGSGATTALANAITGLSGGATLDLTDATTVTNIATSAGVDAMTANATGMLASTSNSAVQQQVSNATNAQDLLTNITAISIVTQGSTAQQLSQSIGDSTALGNTVNNNTGSNFTSQVTNSTSQVGNLSPVSLNPANGALGVGGKVQVTLNVADPVSVNTTNGTPTLALNVNENATYDATASTSTALVFDYIVQAGDNTPELETATSGISLNGGTITDLVTNQPANLSGAQSAVPAGLLTINTVPPPAPSAPVLAAASALGSSSDDIANTSDPTFTGTAAAGTTVTLYAGTVAVGSAVAGANGYSITLINPLSQGSYAFTAKATNAVGTVSPASAATTVSLPGIPAITGTVSDQATILDAPIAPFAHATITDPTAGATETVTIALGGGTLSGSGLSGGSGTYTLSGSDTAVSGELEALVFTPAPAGPETAATTIFEISDQSSSLPVPVLGMASLTDYGVGTIVSVAPSTATGSLRAGGSLKITLTTSSPVTVSGAPTLSLNDNGVATYDAAASTSTALVFDYTVGEGRHATALAVTGVNLPGGATIVDGLGHNAGLTLPPSATFSSLQVDTNPAGGLTGSGLSDMLMVNGNTGALVLDEVGTGPAMTYTPIGGLGPEWQFEGDGSFLGGTDGFLLWDGSSSNPGYGTIVVGEDGGGTAQYTPISLIGPEWQFEGNGPLLGGSSDDFLLWDGSSSSPGFGALAVGAVVSGAAQYTPIGGVGANWSFDGVGDYLGDGKTGFLMEDSNTGNVVVGEVAGGSAQYTLVGGIGPEWQFEGSGNLLSHGQDDFLLWDGSSSSPNFGALVVGEVTGGSAQYTLLGGLGPEWQFLGVGDYDGNSPSEFLIRNGNNGALVIGTIAATNGTYGMTYAQVGGVGPEWNFHAGNVATGV